MKFLIFLIFLIGISIPIFSESFAQDVQLRHNSDPVVVIETNLGKMIIDFFPFEAPNHVKNFAISSSNGYYEGTLFHRIIPGFMIQGGDPNSISGDPNTWGQGGPSEKLDAEFNDIKHNRGIVSMARAQDPNSAGSQFFIVHQDSHFLDEQYTVFGRLATQESFETLDKIAAVQTGANDRPANPEQVRILSTSLEPRHLHPNLLELGEPERVHTQILTKSTDEQTYLNEELGIKFDIPLGWLLQTKSKSNEAAPDVIVLGPKVDGVNPYISLTIRNIEDQTIDELILEKNNNLKEALTLNQLQIIDQSKIKTNVHQMSVVQKILINNDELTVKLQDVIILVDQKLYTFTYATSLDNFENNLEIFDDTLNSFEILSQQSSESKSTEENANQQSEEGGGCLIATATYGSELAPQVQQLRELRDNQLLQTESGTAFMGTFNDIYYSFSPIIADYERENPYFKEAVKLAISPMISTLSIMESAESESEVLGLGLSVIALNIGMYLGIPAIIIFGIKKRN
jgi:peptidyl-prolyl cis-trans isomerase B (cyclophilin B)